MGDDQFTEYAHATSETPWEVGRERKWGLFEATDGNKNTEAERLRVCPSSYRL